MTTQEVSSDTILALVRSIEDQIKNMSSTAEMETLITRLQESLHPNNYLIMELKQKFVDGTMEVNGAKTKSRRTLEKVVDFIGDIIKVNNKIEPGLTVTLGANLRTLNTAMLGLAKIKLEAGDIDKKEFMMSAVVARKNIELAGKCFEDTDFQSWK